MTIARRTLLTAGPTAALGFSRRRAWAQTRPVIKIGVINDQSGPYRDVTGLTGVACARQAVQEFAAGGFDVEIVTADHQNKPDVGSSIVRQWLDQDGVDMVLDAPSSAVALALNGVCRERNKVFLTTASATSDLTGKACSPTTVQWTYDSWMEGKSTGGAMIKNGGDTWYFITPNYAAGIAYQRDTTKFIEAAGGKVVGSHLYPFPETTDFSAALIEAQTSGAKVLGIGGAGADLINIVKQAREFGIPKKMKMAALIVFSTDIHGMGLEMAAGLRMSETYYWDLNDRTRSFQSRIKDKVKLWPNMAQAGNYSAALHYLKAVKDMGPAAAKASGTETVNRMKAIPTDDDCFGKGYVRADGRKMHPVYLFEAKQPSESKHEWDIYKVIAETPTEEAFRPLAEGGCPLIKS
jgi:branched-chain amino acid transport system substrate-binding protein